MKHPRFLHTGVAQRKLSTISGLVAALACVLLTAPIALRAQNPAPAATGGTNAPPDAVAGKSPEMSPADEATLSGFSDQGHMEGPGGVVSELVEDDAKVGGVFQPPLLNGFFQPWFDMKRIWNRDYGLQLGMNFNVLYQASSETLTGVDDAAGARFQLQGMWNLVGRKTKNTGGISFRLEDRQTLGTDIPPSKLGSQFGSATLVGSGFSDFGFSVTEVAWRQTVLDGNFRFGFGKISASSWYNAHALSSALTGFQNLSIRASATKPNVGRGIGFVAGGKLSDRFAVVAGVHDANAVTSGNPFDTIDELEFYYSAELRWFPTGFDRRRWDFVKLQLWYVDETNKGAVPSGYGAAVTASKLFKDRYMPFFTAGVSDGDASIIQNDATLGIAFAFNTKHRAARDVLSLGVNWGDPSDSSLDDQYTTELFYRFQLFQNFAFTPSVQFIASPSYAPGIDSAWVGGIRGRLTF